MDTALSATETLSLFVTGGPVLWILTVMSVVALGLILAKTLQFGVARIGRQRDVETALGHWRSGDIAAALRQLEGSREPAAAIVAGTMRGRQDPEFSEEAVREEAVRRSLLVLGRFRAGLRPLELIAQLSPLLGLLGTVIGMIEAFQALEAAGSRPDPSLLSGGIWEALLTTAAGLIVAIPALFAHSWLESRVDRFRQRLEDAVTRVFTQAGVASAPSQASPRPRAVEAPGGATDSAAYAY
jgi:biopolymer transport protein ExbB